VVIYVLQGADLHMAQLIPLPLSLAPVICRKSRLVLPFCYQLIGVVPDKGVLLFVVKTKATDFFLV